MAGNPPFSPFGNNGPGHSSPQGDANPFDDEQTTVDPDPQNRFTPQPTAPQGAAAGKGGSPFDIDSSVATMDEYTLDASGGMGSPNPLARPGGTLTVVSGSDRGKTFSLKRANATLGRGLDNTIVLSDLAVSRQHLTLEYDGAHYHITDSGSGNGTIVNDREHQGRYRLQNGDKLEIGNTVIKVELVTSAPAWANQKTVNLDGDSSAVMDATNGGFSDSEELSATRAGRPHGQGNGTRSSITAPPGLPNMPPGATDNRLQTARATPLAPSVLQPTSVPPGMSKGAAIPASVPSHGGWTPGSDSLPGAAPMPPGGIPGAAPASFRGVTVPSQPRPFAGSDLRIQKERKWLYPALAVGALVLVGGLGAVFALTGDDDGNDSVAVESIAGSAKPAETPKTVTLTASTGSLHSLDAGLPVETTKEPAAPPDAAPTAKVPDAAPPPPTQSPQDTSVPPKRIEPKAKPKPKPKRIARKPKPKPKRKPKPKPKRTSNVGPALAKAKSQYKSKNFNGAAATLVAAAKKAPRSKAAGMRKKAAVYRRIGKNYLKGKSKSDPIGAVLAMNKARLDDSKVGGAHQGMLRSHVKIKVKRAAGLAVARKRYVDAARLVKVAKSVGAAAKVKAISSKLQSVAAKKVRQGLAAKKGNKAKARRLFIEVKKIVPPSNSSYKAATRELARL